MELAAFRDHQSKRSFRPYEVLTSVDRWKPRSSQEASEILTEGWQPSGRPKVSVSPPVAWDEVASAHRSWEFSLHSWDMLGPILAAYDRSRDNSLLAGAVAIACDWATQFPSVESKSRFAWYDMSVGIRAYRLAYIVDAASRVEAVSSSDIAVLLRCVSTHLDALADDRRFPSHSNHGFYFAAGQLALAGRLDIFPGAAEHLAQAHDRVRDLLSRQFTTEGVHREHSPDYHRMVLDTFRGLLEAGLLKDATYEEMCDRVEEALAWFALPNGRIAMFGDSPHRNMLSTSGSSVRNTVLRLVTSDSRAGRAPPHTWRAFPESGYVVFRDGWPRTGHASQRWSYLAQTCCFHSRVHKHADDLSIVWYDHGHELLVDAGRFGYLEPTDSDSELGRAGFYYADPRRVYVESTRAHNTVEIDGRSYQRRGVKPYGSALLSAGENGGVYYSVCRVRHFKTIDHLRTLLFRPGSWLLLLDHLHDEKGKRHTFTQHFNFAPELQAIGSDGSFEIVLPDEAEHLHAISLLPAPTTSLYRGQEDPELRGWISRTDGELEPCWNCSFSLSERSTARFATLLSFDLAEPIPLSAEVSESGASADLAWRTSEATHNVQFRRRRDQSLELTYKVGVVDTQTL